MRWKSSAGEWSVRDPPCSVQQTGALPLRTRAIANHLANRRASSGTASACRLQWEGRGQVRAGVRGARLQLIRSRNWLTEFRLVRIPSAPSITSWLVLLVSAEPSTPARSAPGLPARVQRVIPPIASIRVCGNLGIRLRKFWKNATSSESCSGRANPLDFRRLKWIRLPCIPAAEIQPQDVFAQVPGKPSIWNASGCDSPSACT